MTSTISCNKKVSPFSSIYWWSLRKNMASAIVYAVLLLFSYPLLIFMYKIFNNSSKEIQNGFLEGCAALVFPVITGGIAILFTLLVAVFMFSYMHKKRSVDVFGALPVTRRTLFFSRYFTGISILLVPFLLCMGLSMLLSIQSFEAVQQLWRSSVTILVSVVVAYTFTAFVAVCCGTTADMVISVLAINGLYPLMVLMCQVISNSTIPGVTSSFNLPAVVYTALSPYSSGIVNAVMDPALTESGAQFLWWFVLLALSIAGCIAVSRKRKAECAQAGFALRLLPVLVRAIACTVAGLVFALVFSSFSFGVNAQNSVLNHYIWFFLGLMIGSFIAHLILTFIYNRGSRGFLKSLISYGVLILVIGAAYMIVSTGMFGMDLYVPQPQQVKQVQFKVNGPENFFLSGADEELFAVYTEQEDIEKVVRVHTSITDNLRERAGYPYAMSLGAFGYMENEAPLFYDVIIKYTLENGCVVERAYSNFTFDSREIAPEVLAVIESQAYKEQTVPILIYDDSSIRSVIAYGSNMTEEAYTVADREQIIGIASALRKDILDDQNVNTSNEETADDAEKTCISVDFCYDIPEEKDASGKVIQTRTQYFNISITEDYKNTWEALDRYHLLPAQ
ncbi:MAG TPA: ABC transporter permease [Candidatus Scatavimonas merdigallinarum]|uniref:ABC transporter permease n=1 Tax=Candidatus Scatavimonas merdigallinarum TaxID=2840914 RepID=A0A9D0ZHI8_9FIRM|nr:ABC transporter permease [Candidatus Scatavimonas merdigallinarum]